MTTLAIPLRVRAKLISTHPARPCDTSMWRSSALIRRAIDPDFLRYLFYALSTPKMQRQAPCRGPGLVEHENRLDQSTMIEAFDVQVSSRRTCPRQRVIAHILGTLDDKIELNRRMNETLEGMARALFKSWLRRFRSGPSQDGRPGHGLAARHLADLFPRPAH